jgi:predicted phosphodiesterase
LVTSIPRQGQEVNTERLFGVISDTHGLIRDGALLQLAGSNLIIHAGDVGKPAVVDTLRKIAPLRAVHGNVDIGAWAETLPATLVVAIQKIRILVVHNIADLAFDPAARGFAAVVFGSVRFQ